MLPSFSVHFQAAGGFKGLAWLAGGAADCPGTQVGLGSCCSSTAWAGVCRLEKGACKETELHLYKATSRSRPSLAFAFFISFILVPPLTAFYGRTEVFSVSSSAIFLWDMLIPLKSSGGSCLVVRCSSSTQRAEGAGSPGSHEDTTEAHKDELLTSCWL